MRYLPLGIILGVMAWKFCPYFKEDEEVTSGEESLEAVKEAIRKMH